MPAVTQQCQVCGGESFTTAHGIKVCDLCGRQEEHYIELLSQETIGEVDRSRLITTRLHEQEGEEGSHSLHSDGGKLNNWTSYEAYNVVLYEWTKALLKLGASPKVEKIVFKLWVAYLKRLGIAFSPRRKSSCRSSLKNSRDMQVIHEKAESVSSRSLQSLRSRRKKKKAAPTKLDKIRDKIESKKMRNALKKKHDSSFMDTTLASELSKSLNELETSMLSESSTFYTADPAGDSKMSLSVKSEASSAVNGSHYIGPLESESEVERDVMPFVERKQIRRDTVVMNWIKRATHIYESDSEDEYQEENRDGKMESEKMEEEDDEEVSKDDSEQSCGISWNTRRRKRVKASKYKEKKLKRQKKATQASEVNINRASQLPLMLRFSKLLGILYLAVLLAEDDILLSDIIRWCREGHIPYFSAPYLLQPDMELFYYDLYMLRNSKRLPDAQEVQVITGQLALFLSIQYVPLPPLGKIVQKFVKLLNLPEHVAAVAESLVELTDDWKIGLAVPPVESMAMASIIFVLKLYCGLDSHTEVMLSSAAAAVTAEVPCHGSITPFSWQHWQKHISRLLWVCCQVDPPAAFQQQQLHDNCYFSPTVFSNFFWREYIWRAPRSSRKKKTGLQILAEEFLQCEGLSLEEVITQPPLFQPSRQPFRSTIEQLLQTHSTSETKEMHSYIKVAEELTTESFTNHSLDWFCEMDRLASEPHKYDSKIKLLPLTNEEGKAGFLCRVQTSEGDYEVKEKKKTYSTQKSFIPHPLKNVWKIKPEKYATWEKLSPFLPSSFKWLVGVCSHMCEAPKKQLLSLVCMLQNKVI